MNPPKYTAESVRAAYQERMRIKKELQDILLKLKLIRADARWGKYPIDQAIAEVNIAIKAQEEG